MPHKCIHMHIYKEFAIWSRIQAYKGDVNVYGPLWTPTCICAVWTFFFIILYVFPSTASCMTSPPYILLSTPYSPVICKDFFPLVYMYKLSRYYAIFHIDLSPMFPWSTILEVLKLAPLQPSSTFGYYCQRLPGLTTKSTQYYSYFIHYHTRFTFITQRIQPPMLSFDFVPLDPLAPKLTTRLSADTQIPMTQ